jgi:RNA polymerase sigma-70 factor, ECF subfamily
MHTAATAVINGPMSVESLYRADSERLWRAVYAFAGDPDLASDAVAEAYAQVLARGEAIRDPLAWTWRAAFRIASGSLKARLPTGSRIPDKHYMDHHADADLIQALSKLPSGQRAAVVLFYYADLPVSDVAHRLGTNGLAVRANLSRGRRRLRQLLGEPNG